MWCVMNVVCYELACYEEVYYERIVCFERSFISGYYEQVSFERTPIKRKTDAFT